MHSFTSVKIGTERTYDNLNNYQVDVGTDLEKRLKEMIFISRFMGATSASLVPHDICSIAARIVYDFIPYDSIHFCLAPDFGIDALVFSPGRIGEGIKNPSAGKSSPVQSKQPTRNCLPRDIISISADAGKKRVEMALPDAMGKIIIVFDKLKPKTFSAVLFSELLHHFTRTLKNALAHEKVKELATKDSLTGLFNRRVFDELLAVEMNRKELLPVSLLLIDLDDFKLINDNFGHPAGDEVLTTIGKILREGCRGSDLVARYGGEEFAVMLPATTSSAAFEIAKRLRTRIAGTVYVFDGSPVNLTASIGIAHTTGNRSDDMSKLVSRADQALYRAKKGGKNMTYVYTTKALDITNKPSAREKAVAWLRSA